MNITGLMYSNLVKKGEKMALTLSDYYIKIGNTKLPNRYIAKESYQANLDFQVAGTYQNALGETHEDYFPYKKLVVRFTTSNMTQNMLETFLEYFEFIDGTEDIMATCWVPKINDYVTQRVKVEGLSPVLNTLSTRHTAIYNGFAIAFTGRGGEV